MSCSGECNVKNFGLNHKNPEQFVNSQWKIPQAVYMGYRILVAVFFLTWIILSGVLEYQWYTTESNRLKWFIYLTNWMFFLLTLETIVEMIVVGTSMGRIKNGKDYKKMPWQFKATWVLYNMASTIGIVVSLAFWILLYPAIGSCSSNKVLQECGSPVTPTCSDPNPIAAAVCEKRCGCPTEFPIWYDGQCIKLADCPSLNSTEYSNATDNSPVHTVYTLHFMDIITHGVNSAYIIFNLFVTGIPLRIQHFWQAIPFAVTYVLFSLIYDVAGGTNARDRTYIYSAIDWTAKPGWSTAYAIGAGIIAPILVWLVLYGLYRVRLCIAKCCGCGREYYNSDNIADSVDSSGVMLNEKGDPGFGSMNTT